MRLGRADAAADASTTLLRGTGGAGNPALSPDGRTLYFTRSGLRSDNARQYRGGAIARLWTLDLTDKAEARPLVAEGNNDRRPMPYRIGNEARIAFLSDRDGTVNLWSVNAQGGDLRQHSSHKGWDIRHASLDGSRVVYALGADLYLVDLAQGAAPARLAISLGGDFDQQRERWVKKPQDFLTDTSFAPNGERVLLAARGHLATQGVQQLRRAELPQPADGRCRNGEFSSDSKGVFAICDFSGETEIWRFAANGTAQPERLTSGATTLRLALLPSPNGRWLAHTDKEHRVWLTDLKSRSTRQIAQGERGAAPELLAWSPDGQALAWTRSLRHPDRAQLQLFSPADGRTHTLTSDRYDTTGAAFSPDGQWLYFASSRNFVATAGGSPWGDRNTGTFFGARSKLYALALQPGLRSPFAAKDELESPAEKKADEQRADDKKATDKNPTERKPDAKDAKPDPKAKPPIQFDGLAARLFELPTAPGNYRGLRADGARFRERHLARAALGGCAHHRIRHSGAAGGRRFPDPARRARKRGQGGGRRRSRDPTCGGRLREEGRAAALSGGRRDAGGLSSGATRRPGRRGGAGGALQLRYGIEVSDARSAPLARPAPVDRLRRALSPSYAGEGSITPSGRTAPPRSTPAACATSSSSRRRCSTARAWRWPAPRRRS